MDNGADQGSQRRCWIDNEDESFVAVPEFGRSCMKKAFLIITLSLFGAVAIVPAPGGSSVVFAQKKDKDDKKNPTPPPVVRDKGKQDKAKEPPPRKDRRPE